MHNVANTRDINGTQITSSLGALVTHNGIDIGCSEMIYGIPTSTFNINAGGMIYNVNAESIGD